MNNTTFNATLNLTKAQDAFVRGDFIATTYYVWNEITTGLFALLVFLLIEIVLFLKVEHEGMPTIFGIIFAGFAYKYLPPEIQTIAYVLVALVFAVDLTRAIIGSPD